MAVGIARIAPGPFLQQLGPGALSQKIARAKLVRSQIAIDEASRRDESPPMLTTSNSSVCRRRYSQ